MLVNLRTMLAKAMKGGYAVPAFNINNMEIAQAVIEAAIERRSPVILQASEGGIAYAGLPYLAAIAHVAAESTVPVAFHVDHGKNYALVRKLILSGEFSSAMYDGSTLPYAENLKNTKVLVKLAHARGMTIEAELGAIRGTEDHVSVAEREAFFTDPAQAQKFVAESGCDALAISVGTAHGAYKFEGKTVLDFERILAIRALVDVPLVLHGASHLPPALVTLAEAHGADLTGVNGVSDAALTKAVRCGITKVNIDSDLRIAFTAAVREALDLYPSTIDPRKVLLPARALMKKIASQKMDLLGSAGRASR